MKIGLIFPTASTSGEPPSRACSGGLALVAQLHQLDSGLTFLGYGPPGERTIFPEWVDCRRVPPSARPWEDLADRNPDRLDALLVLDPLAMLREGSSPPAKPLNRLAMLAVLDDPQEVQGSEGDWLWPGREACTHAAWPRLRRYDFLFTSTINQREIWAALLGLPLERLQPIEDSETLDALAVAFLARQRDGVIRQSTRSTSREISASADGPGKTLAPSLSEGGREKENQTPLPLGEGDQGPGEGLSQFNARFCHRPGTTRARLAIFSPWPPIPTGIADYAANLAKALRDRYAIDLYHEPGFVPSPGLRAQGFGAFEPREFARRDRVIGYRGVLYQMGNSHYHGFIYDQLRKRPGLVTLHDFCLSGFQFWRAHRDSGDPFENLRRLIAEHYPESFEAMEPELRAWTEEPGGFAEALTRRGLAVNRDVFEASQAVVLHSPWCLAWSARSWPESATKAALIPLGAEPRAIPLEQRYQVRARFGLPQDQTLIGVFGIMSPGKMNPELIAAFREVADEHPKALLVFVGADWEGGAARQAAQEHQLSDRVRFLGRQPEGDYQDLIGSMDLGVSLRRPPTQGETSAALLDLLRHGIPTIVNEAGTFADYPETIVRRVHWERDGHEGLVASLRELLADQSGRQALGEAARRYVREHHAWVRVAALYSDWIDRTASEDALPSLPRVREAI